MNGCLKVFLIVLLSLFLLVGSCSLFIYNKVKDFPELAKKEIAENVYKDLITNVDSILVNTDDYEMLINNLQSLEPDERIIYLGLVNNEDDEIEVIKKFDFNTSSKFVFNGIGMAKVDSIDVIVLEREINQSNLDNCILYLLPEDEDINISY